MALVKPLEATALYQGGENEMCKIPDRLSLSHDTGWCEAEVFRHGRWHVITLNLSGFVAA